MQGPHFPCWQNLPGGPPDADAWRVCELQGFREAEELLDQLERCGVADREFVLLERGLAVRWRPPARAAHEVSPVFRLCALLFLCISLCPLSLCG